MESRRRILVVDDERDMCWALDLILGRGRVEVRTATKGRDALKLVQKGFFKAVVLDAKLLDMDGFEVAEKIKSQSPDTKIIIISGYYHQDDPEIQEGMESGLFSGFLSKPFDLPDIRRIAREIVGGEA